MPLSIIVAMAENGVIGRGGTLPWHISEDLKRFKRLTMGHAILMGRRTWDSLGRPLPGRRSIVVSRNPEFRAVGAEVAGSLDEALRLAAGGSSPTDDEVFVIGGASLYREALPLANRLHVTRVHAVIEGDTFFPEFNVAEWRLVEDGPVQTDAASSLRYNFQCYERQ
ncbi:MAG: dihydrofolate reductase [Planctomycetia bacterium]|nr:dihydrofolate reductase [Planctomycetia bacterium]